MEYSPGDFLDKYSILWIKAQHGLDVEDEINSMNVEAEYYFLKKKIKEIYEKLLESNSKQFDLEDCLRTSNDLAEAGKFALEIRKFNTNRVNYKNEINELTSFAFLEQKKYKE